MSCSTWSLCALCRLMPSLNGWLTWPLSLSRAWGTASNATWNLKLSGPPTMYVYSLTQKQVHVYTLTQKRSRVGGCFPRRSGIWDPLQLKRVRPSIFPSAAPLFLTDWTEWPLHSFFFCIVERSLSHWYDNGDKMSPFERQSVEEGKMGGKITHFQFVFIAPSPTCMLICCMLMFWFVNE